MTTFVIVHGAFGGGWEWTPVADALRREGDVAFTPTLTGMGERAHLGPAVGMATNVEDVVAVIELEDLSGVVLCGASYGGMAVTGAADRLPDRIQLLVYIDALVPVDGQCGLDLLPEWFGDMVRAAAREEVHGWVPVPKNVLPPESGIAAEERQRFIDRLRPQPVASFTDPIRLTGVAGSVPRAFVRCTGGQFKAADDPIEAMAARARSEGWLYRELPLPHDPHLFDVAATVAVLRDVAKPAAI